MRKLSLIFAGVVVAALGIAPLSFAVAQPTAPSAGARTNSHPTFTWSLPANEEADFLRIASSPATTPSGEFHQENVVETGFLGASSQTTWSPSSALFAGQYWWNVLSHDREEFNTVYSAPSPFTVAAQTRVRQLRIRRDSYFYIPDELSITIGWATNVRNVVVEAKLYRGRRQVGRVRDATETFASLSGDSSTLTWKRPPRVKTGTRLRVVVSVRGGGAVASLQRFVRAP
jgi:hypothetical protein